MNNDVIYAWNNNVIYAWNNDVINERYFGPSRNIDFYFMMHEND